MTEILIHADVIDDNAREQIENTGKSPALQGLIAIMPDVHFGAGSVIGFTGKFKDAVIPNIVGVDIGCGVSCHELGKIDINFSELDKYIRKNIPLGFKSRHCNMRAITNEFNLSEIVHDIGHNISMECLEFDKVSTLAKHPVDQLGTLGGGNHFIEIDENSKGERFLVIHSGSRNFGLRVATYFQRKAKELCDQMLLELPKGLEYLPMSLGGNEYITWLHKAQKYASVNRLLMTEIILKYFNIEYVQNKYIESVHNFISPKDNIIRKGAISAHKGEKVIIPLNMAEGCIIGTGKGVSKYNFSAPHGAGRVFGRKEMERQLDSGVVTMDQFEKSMDGVFSTCIHKSTIDESPFAYKKYESIEKHVKETIDVEDIIRPLYNLKG